MKNTLSAGTKGRKIEGIATVTNVGSWMSASWYSPRIDFDVNGEKFMWRSNDEFAVEGLRVGDTVSIRAFCRENGRLYRVSWSKLGVAA